MNTWSLVIIAIAYLMGSLSFAVIVSRAFGLADPRTVGSGNPGASNVLRSGNKAAAAATLVLDALKGYIPVVLAYLLAQQYGWGNTTIALVGFAAFIGHLWPVFFRFKGGKGVATAAGVLFAFNPFLGLATLATWAIIAAFFRFSSLASMTAAVFAPFYQFFFLGEADITLLVTAAMSVLLVWRHHANVDRLLKGTEPKFGQKAKA